MGNSISLTSDDDWISAPLRKQRITIGPISGSGTFFVKYEGRSLVDDTKLIVKGYKSNQLKEMTKEINILAENFFKRDLSICGILKPAFILGEGNEYVIFIREKLEKSLVDYSIFQQPPVDKEEKIFIFYQLATYLSILHSEQLFHGDIKPNNIFVNRGLFVNMVDPAPYKPYIIDPKMKHLFYHLFTTNDTGCCLAPERISESADPSEIDMRAADVFSLGCSMVYLFLDGHHLFSLDSLIDYKEGRFDIEKTLDKIGDDDIKELLLKLLNKDPKDRILAEDTIKYFDEFYSSAKRYFANLGNSGENLFENNPEKAFYLLNSLLSLAQPKHLIVIFAYVSDQLLKINNVDSIILGLNFITSMSIQMSTNIKLTRVIPFLMYYTKFISQTILHTSLYSILEVLKSIDEIPEYLNGYFTYYLNNELNTLWNQISDENNLNKDMNNNSEFSSYFGLVTLAEFVPHYCIIVSNFSPDSLQNFSILQEILTTQKFEIFQYFSNSFQSVIHKSDISLFSSLYLYFLSNMNLPDERFKTEVFKIISGFCNNIKGNDIKYKTFFQDKIIYNCLDILSTESVIKNSDQLLCIIFKLIEKMIRNNIIEPDITYEFFQTIDRCNDTNNDELKYYLNRMLRVSPKKIRELGLCSFVKKVNNPSIKTINKIDYPKDSRKKITPMINDFDMKKLVFPKSIKNFEKPRFLTSFHSESVPITHIFGSPNGSQCIFINKSNKINWVNLTDENERVQVPSKQITHMTRSKIMAAQPLSSTKFIVGFDNGEIDSFEFKISKKVVVEKPRNEIITSMRQINDSVVLCSHMSGLLSLYDLRESGSCSQMKYQIPNISDICIWNDYKNLAGIGFKDGYVSLVDLRMFKPVWGIKTAPVDRIIPASCPFINDSCSFYIQNRNHLELISEQNTKILLTYDSRIDVMLPFEGGALLIDDISTSFFSSSTKNKDHSCYRFSDLSYRYHKIITDKTTGTDIVLPYQYDTSESKCKFSSLHKHFANITCAAKCGSVFVSGDDVGNMNVWKI